MTDSLKAMPEDILRPLDLALVRFFSERVPGLADPVCLAIGLVSYQLGRGHVCLDLAQALEDPVQALGLSEFSSDTALSEAAHAMRDRLASLSVQDWVGSLSEATDLVAQADRALGNTCPLVIAGHRLYLRRYWQYERAVETAIRNRIDRQAATDLAPDAAGFTDTDNDTDTASALFASTLSALFAPQESSVSASAASPASAASIDQPLDWQKIACAIAARGRFAVITGGPGTGKTTTVVRLLALLQTLALASPEAQMLRVAVAAPTGKAAARLRSALTSARGLLPVSMQQQEAFMQSIPSEVTTLHRLLGARVDSRQFQHNAHRLLPIDLLVIDEASMIDLEMMAAVVEALSSDSRLVLLGDKDQLSSVEAGGVLGQLCARAEVGHYTADTAQWLLKTAGMQLPSAFIDGAGRDLDQQLVMLRQSRRFDPSGGIGRIAAAVHAADTAALQQVLQLLQGGHDNSVRLHSLVGPLPSALQPVFLQCLNPAYGAAGADGADHGPRAAGLGIDGFLRLLHRQRPSPDASQPDYDHWAMQILQARSRFQVLCALRNGPLGVDQLNRAVEAFLTRQGLLHPQGLWYEGRPVLVTRNDYSLGLMNGDMGVALSLPVEHPVTGVRETVLRVAFLTEDSLSSVRWVLPSRLTSAQTVFALTVHKSQGSEFDECLMVLPDARHLGLTRELLYTGITRARHRLGIAAQGGLEEVLTATTTRRTQRAGGLFD
jgi:exodeoxyribonuclease V alpha subunit